jgi:hypothetical protein
MRYNLLFFKLHVNNSYLNFEFFANYVECNWFTLFKSFTQGFFFKLQESLDIETFVTIFFKGQQNIIEWKMGYNM